MLIPAHSTHAVLPGRVLFLGATKAVEVGRPRQKMPGQRSCNEGTEILLVCRQSARMVFFSLRPHAGAKANAVQRTGENSHTTCYIRRMRLHDYAPRPAHLKWLLDSDPAIRWQVMRDLAGEAPNAIAAERSRVATEGWGAQLLALQSPAGNWGGPKEDRGLLFTLYTLVVLKDLGLDPASKQARKMIDRVDKRLVFKPLNNRPFLHGETEPCINGRILVIGSYFKEPNDALANQLLGEQLEDGGGTAKHPKAGAPRSIPPSACSKDCSNTNEQGANRRPLLRPARGPKTICSTAACSARFEPAKRSTNAGSASRSQRFGTTTSCADSIICGMQESNPTAASVTPSKP
jgi:hypothetical protein